MQTSQPLCVVSEQYCEQRSVELTVSKKALSMSGEGFRITDSEGRLFFKMDGHALSIRDRCTLLDAEGNPILTARKKHESDSCMFKSSFFNAILQLISMHERWEVCEGEHFHDDALLFTVKKTSMMQFKTHLTVFLTGNDNDDAPDYEVKGNFMEREGQILHGRDLVAELKRKFTAPNVMLDKHTFATWVAPMMDQAFVACLVIIMDRIHED
ncbi:hypothetical protein L7F22_062771 [Adiantum nelumboides]|nr:hypothetical protein [Adiantum nelumboides]